MATEGLSLADGGRRLEAGCRRVLGTSALRRGRFLEARHQFSRAVALNRELEDWDAAAQAGAEFGELLREAGLFRSASAQFRMIARMRRVG